MIFGVTMKNSTFEGNVNLIGSHLKAFKETIDIGLTQIYNPKNNSFFS